jgi:hypothetical protein
MGQGFVLKVWPEGLNLCPNLKGMKVQFFNESSFSKLERR